MVEILHQGTRVTVHRRSWTRGGYSTEPAHRPKAHQQHLEWTPSRLIQWGTSMGPATGAVIEYILASKPHPEMGYRSCLGLFSLGKRYGKERLEAAAVRALRTGAISYRSLKSMLAKSLDKAPLPAAPVETRLPPIHENIRGREYYAAAPLNPHLSLITAMPVTTGGT
jgi:hypothetical protein